MKHFPFFGHSKSRNHRKTASQSQILHQTVQSVFPEANPWRADFSQTFVCNNNQDNIPIESIISKKNEKFTFVISQNRGSTKTMGQDCMALAKHGKFEVIVLSDGHDKEGHLVSQGVCGILPSILLRLIHEREDQTVDIDDDLIYDAFDECEQVVCWSFGEATPGGYVRIAAGEYEGVAGYCTGFDEENNAIVSVVEEYEVEGGDEIEVGYLEIVVSPEDILVPRFSGGGTCIVIIRNVESNSCRIAVAGDSRIMIYLPNDYPVDYLNDSAFVPTYGTKINPTTKKPYSAYLTPQHNVYNQDELARLKEDYSDAYMISGSFLVNPDTEFMIQPTRGFGDHDMHGTGYTHIPQLSDTFTLPTNALVILASDGVFDDNVWSDREIVDRIGELYTQQETSNLIAKKLYEETLIRSEESGYVDDISVICYNAPELIKKAKSNTTKASLKKEVKVEQDNSLPKKLSARSIPGVGKNNKDLKRHTLKRNDKLELQLPSLIESILDVGPGASFDEIESKFNQIEKKKTLTMEEKMSHKTLIKGDKKPSQRKIVQKREVQAKVKKGGKTYKKNVKGSKKGKGSKKKSKQDKASKKQKLKQESEAAARERSKLDTLLDPHAELAI